MAKINRETVSRTLPTRKALTLCGLIALIALAGCAGMLGGEQGTATPTPTDENTTDNQSSSVDREPPNREYKTFQYIAQNSERESTLRYNWSMTNLTGDTATVFATTPDRGATFSVNQSAAGQETAMKFGSRFTPLWSGTTLANGRNLEPGNSWTTDNSVTVTVGENQTIGGVQCTTITADRPDAEVPSTWCVNQSDTYPFALSYEQGPYELRLARLSLP